MNRPPADSVLCVPSHSVPGYAIFFLCGLASVGLRPSPLLFAVRVSSQRGAGDLIVAIPQGMAKPSKFSPHDFKVNITLASYSPHLCFSCFFRSVAL
jgi:hypothetical protein